MSQPMMPEPVAWRYTDARGHYRYRGYIARFDSLYPILRPESLITTTQAEAYADARVREALEPSFDKAFSLLSAWLRSTQSVADMGQVATLSTLVEFALANQGKTNDQLEAEFKLPAPAQQ